MTEQFQKDIFAIIEADTDNFDIFIEICSSSFRLSRSLHHDIRLIKVKEDEDKPTMEFMKAAVIKFLNETQDKPGFNQEMISIIDHLKI